MPCSVAHCPAVAEEMRASRRRSVQWPGHGPGDTLLHSSGLRYASGDTPSMPSTPSQSTLGLDSDGFGSLIKNN